MRTVNGMVVAAVLVAGGWAAGQERAAGATTRASGEVVEIEVSKEAGSMGAHVQVATGQLRLRIASGVAEVPTVAEIRDVFRPLRWLGGGPRNRELKVFLERYSPVGREVVLTYAVAAPELERPAEDVAERARAAFVGAFREMVEADAGMSARERRERLAEVSIRLTEVRAMREALGTMAQAQPPRAEVLRERIKALREERQRLEAQRVAREARRIALRDAVKRQEKVAAEREARDAVAEELREVLKLREQEMQMVEAQHRQGLTTAAEMAAARARAAEARIRLAEREAEAGRREVLDRLADEMAMVEVDLADMEIQLQMVRGELDQLDPAKATTRSLEGMVKEEPAPPGPPALFGELERRERELVKEKVRLAVEGVEEVK